MFHISLASRYFAQQPDESQTVSYCVGFAQNVFFKLVGGKGGESATRHSWALSPLL